MQKYLILVGSRSEKENSCIISPDTFGFRETTQVGKSQLTVLLNLKNKLSNLLILVGIRAILVQFWLVEPAPENRLEL